jgi:hypothetical protein
MGERDKEAKKMAKENQIFQEEKIKETTNIQKQQLKLKKDQQVQENIDISSWRTYQNKKFSFEFKYSSNLPLVVRECDYIIGFSINDEDITSCGKENLIKTPINIIKTIFDSEEEAKESVLRSIEYRERVFEQKTQRNLNVDDIEAVEISGVWKSEESIGEKSIIGSKNRIILFSKENFTYSISLDYSRLKGLNENIIEHYEKIFDEILLTYKFIK